MSKMTAMEKVNGCIALLVQLCMLETNATKVTIDTQGITYIGKPIGDYKLVIERTDKATDPANEHKTSRKLAQGHPNSEKEK